MSYTVTIITCPCNNNCELLSNMYADSIFIHNYLYKLVTSEFDNNLSNYVFPQFHIFTINRKYFHIKWYTTPSIIEQQCLEKILIKLYSIGIINHFYNIEYKN